MSISRTINKKAAAVLAPLALAGGLAAPVAAVAAPAGHQATAAVTGDGSNNNPYVAPCDNPSQVDCTVSGFAWRSLNPWASDSLPAYQCPADHPYLLNQRWPYGLFNLPGVQVEKGPDVDVSITHDKLVSHWKTGILSGFPNTATNWSFTNSEGYHVILHCTSDGNHAA